MVRGKRGIGEGSENDQKKRQRRIKEGPAQSQRRIKERERSRKNPRSSIETRTKMRERTDSEK